MVGNDGEWDPPPNAQVDTHRGGTEPGRLLEPIFIAPNNKPGASAGLLSPSASPKSLCVGAA